jgi:hypothetical protein
MPLWVILGILAIIVFIAARWIISVIDRDAHMIVEHIDQVGQVLEAIGKKIESK